MCSPGVPMILVERQPAKDGKFFDLQGHQLTAQPTQRGIYIRNGMKFVVK